MKNIHRYNSFFLIIFLSSCSALTSDLYKAVDDIATDDAISIQIDRDAIKKDTDIHVSIDVLNKSKN